MNGRRWGSRLLIAALLIFAGTVLAQEGGVRDLFARADRDGSGALSMDEFLAMPGPHHDGNAQQLFADLDLNSDGLLQPEEMRQAHEAHQVQAFRTADIDQDGKLSEAEFMAFEPQHARGHMPMERLDVNGDGRIEKTEAQNPPPPPDRGMRGMHQARPDMPPPPRGEGPGGMDEKRPDRPGHVGPKAPGQPHDPAKWFEECDVNADGVVDQTELGRHREMMRHRAFVRMDEDEDGFLQPEEFGPMGHPGPRPPEVEPLGLEPNPDKIEAMEEDEDTQPIPAGFWLSDNFPNPFNSTTAIRYSIPFAAHVTLTVYNLAGEAVCTLVDEEQTADEYEVKVRLTEQTSGTYFYRLHAGTLNAVNRMIYVK